MQAFVSALHPKHVVIGFNYSFGKMGAGKAADMRRFGEQYGFETHVVDEVQIGGLPGFLYARACRRGAGKHGGSR